MQAGHSLTTFELTITRLASKVRQIVSDKIGSRDIEDDEHSGYDSSAASDYEVGSTDSTGQEEDDGEQKWRKRRRKKPERKHYPSSSEYESEESEGPDSLCTSSSYSDDEKGHYKRKCK